MIRRCVALAALFLLALTNAYLLEEFADVEYRPFSPYINVTQLSFGVVLDLGSSGTRAHIFYWDDERSVSIRPAPDHPCLCMGECALQQQLCETIDEGSEGTFWVKKATPGVGSYGDNPLDAGSSIVPLLDFAESLIPEEKLADTPIIMFATAGLRILPDETVNEILESLREQVHARQFRFQDDWCRVISGTDEAVFGWVSIQEVVFLLTESEGGVDGNGESTVGVVDQGGASVEMAFVPTDYNWDDDSLAHYRRHAIFNEDVFAVYVHSYLGYGINEARKAYLKYLLAAYTKRAVVDDPCLPLGATEMSDGVEISGSGDPAQCAVNLNTFLFPQNCTDYDTCSFGNVFQPPIEEDMVYFALDKVASVARFLGVPAKGAPLSELSENAGGFCQLTTEEIAQQYTAGDEGKAEKLYRSCFDALFCYNLLINFGFSPQSEKVRYSKEYSGIDMSWALGAMVEMKENDFVFKSSSSWGSSTLDSFHLWLLVGSVLGVVFLAGILFGAGFLVHRRFRKARMAQVADTDDVFQL